MAFNKRNSSKQQSTGRGILGDDLTCFVLSPQCVSEFYWYVSQMIIQLLFLFVLMLQNIQQIHICEQKQYVW